MKRNLTLGIGILSAFAFLVTFFIGIGVSSQIIWKEIVPFSGVIIALTLVFSKGTCCRFKKGC
jgi:hypothetical protein